MIDFPGFLRAYEEGRDTPREQEVLLPPVAEGDGVKATELEPVEHATTPPARLTPTSRRATG